MSSSLYCCYSIKVRDYLKQNGIPYELVAENPNSHKIFWVYIRNEKLDEFLTKWSTKKQAIFYLC